jgi:hypothetical protein
LQNKKSKAKQIDKATSKGHYKSQASDLIIEINDSRENVSKGIEGCSLTDVNKCKQRYKKHLFHCIFIFIAFTFKRMKKLRKI